MSQCGLFPTFSRQRTSVAFGTVINVVIPGSGFGVAGQNSPPPGTTPRIDNISPMNNTAKGRKTKVTNIDYLAGGTAHTITAMRPLGATVVVSDAAAGATSLVIKRDPGAYAANALADKRPVPSVADNLIAANDTILVEQPDGILLLTIPSAAATDASGGATNGQVTLTVSALPTGGIKANAAVWFFGLITDIDPRTGVAHPTFLTGTGASPLPTTANQGCSLVETLGKNEPMILQSNNATATGAFNTVSGVYADA